MLDNVTSLPTPETPPIEKKKRTITLTNRAPIQIVEDDWPVTAHGLCGEDWYDQFGWKIEIRVRHYAGKNKYPTWRTIIHASYEYDTDDESKSQTARVGRILHADFDSNGDTSLWAQIREVGDELRERISNDHLRRHVIYAVDECFAKLPPIAVP